MSDNLSISPVLESIGEVCTAGYAIGLHIKFTTPTFFFQSYSKDWLTHYSNKGMVIHDPIVRWGFENTGMADWDELSDMDERNVLGEAAEYGLNHGVVISLLQDGSRTIAGFSRTDRKFSEAEATQLHEHLTQLHNLTKNLTALPSAERAALKQLSIITSQG